MSFGNLLNTLCLRPISHTYKLNINVSHLAGDGSLKKKVQRVLSIQA